MGSKEISNDFIEECKDEVLNDINDKLDKNIERINDFNEILKTKGNPRIITESFVDNESFSDNNLMYRERYNEYIDKSLHINYDFKNSRITLPLLSKTNMLMYDNGVSTASIKINKQIGENFLNINSSSSLDSVIS